MKPKVAFFQRKPYLHGTYSLEFVSSDIRSKLSEHIDSRLHISSFHSNGFFRRIFILLEAIFKQEKVNIIMGDIHYVALFLKKKRTILTIADCGSLYDGKEINLWLKKLFWYALPIWRSQYVTTISEYSKQEVLRFINCDPNKVVVIPIGISDEFTYSPKIFNKKIPELLQVGQTHNKNLARIIQAIKGLNVKLSIIGKLSEESIELLSENSVNFTNSHNLSIQQVTQKYIDCDILVFPSTYEGFGMPILEAQATGRVVLTSNVTSMPWVAGEGACLVDPFSVESIRAGVLKVIHDDNYRNMLIECGLENIKRFDSKQIALQYLDLIKKIALE